VRLTDVVRAALSEVEDYHRVTVHGVEPATVVGSATADLAHLIAELLENALTLSPPDQRVEIRGRRGRARDGYELAIVDTGCGMPTADLERANRRLAGTESFTVAPSKYLGHYVAGILATRHGIAIRLDPTPGRGTTASIDLPPELLAPADPVPAAGSAPEAGSAVGAPDASLAPGGGPRGSPADSTWKPRPVPALPTGDRPTVPHTNIQRTAPGPVERPNEPGSPNAPGSPGWDRRSAPDTGATSAGGLERRVPGAQLPATEPVLLRRDTAARPAAPAPVARRDDHQHSPAAAAQDVYDSLRSFRAGMQRGLDEARRAIDRRAHPRRQEGSDQ
jgi:hypothetical protein